MNCVDKKPTDWPRDCQDKVDTFNDSQRWMVNQFVEFYTGLMRAKVECQLGTELIINAMQIKIYSPMSMDTLMQRTGLEYADLSNRVRHLEEKGVVVCNENKVKFTKAGLDLVNGLSDSALKMLMATVERIKNENNFPD